MYPVGARAGVTPADGLTKNGEEGESMKRYRDVYDFAAGAGALEGYVYQKGDTDIGDLSVWAGRLESQYRSFPPEIVEEFQDLCDRTLGRAIRSLTPRLGEDHPVIARLRGMTRGELPTTPDDFERPA
jgi:hypothetical protein